MASVPEEWNEWVAQIKAALPRWDAWCPDDGRPAHALRVAEDYAAGKATDDQIERATSALSRAGWMCAGAGGVANNLVVYRPEVNRAWRVAWAVLLLAQAVRYPLADNHDWDLARSGVEHLNEVSPG